MKEDLLGLNHWLSLPATCHTVSPRSSALSSGHLRMAPPKSSSGMPRCLRYHAASEALSPLLFRNTPPIPVTFAIVPPHVVELRDARVALRVTMPRRTEACARRAVLVVRCRLWSQDAPASPGTIIAEVSFRVTQTGELR